MGSIIMILPSLLNDIWFWVGMPKILNMVLELGPCQQRHMLQTHTNCLLLHVRCQCIMFHSNFVRPTKQGRVNPKMESLISKGVLMQPQQLKWVLNNKKLQHNQNLINQQMKILLSCSIYWGFQPVILLNLGKEIRHLCQHEKNFISQTF